MGMIRTTNKRHKRIELFASQHPVASETVAVDKQQPVAAVHAGPAR